MTELNDEKSTGRIEAFSDGVFAIAITLLILELKVPEPEAPGYAGLLSALGRLWPSYLAFVMSFTVILVMWVNHHRIFSLVRRSDDAFLYWNGLLLLFVTIVPFPTAVLARYLLESEHEARIAAAVYSGMGVLSAIAFTALWRHAIRDERLLVPGRREEVRELNDQYRFGPLAYLVAFALSFVSSWASVGVCLALALVFALRGLWGKR